MPTHKTAVIVLALTVVTTGVPARAESAEPARSGAASAPAPRKPRPPGQSTKPPKKRTPKKGPEPPKDAPAVPPLTSESLEAHARLLLDAVARGEPELADPFFFPREPFLTLKDVDDPGRYHQELVRAYHQNIKELHARRRSWDGVRYVSFELGSPPHQPRWTEPGHEWNKLGYYRVFDARLTYEAAGRKRTLVVRTIISWEGEWYVTHLSPMKH